jgi:fibronectin type 3 domain-containing protein
MCRKTSYIILTEELMKVNHSKLPYLGNYIKLVLLVFVFTCQGISINAQTTELPLAFPGAEGFGRHVTGGRGGALIKVTNLNDSGPGSLRAALDTRGPRIIVFEVSGNIALKTPLRINYPDVTIAGQTAPGEGITIQNYPMMMDFKNNVIIRYLRFRLGELSGVQYDAFESKYCKDVIIDHCSFSWGTDEVASFIGNENITIQWSMIAEALNISVHAKGEHGYGGILGGKNTSFHHNLIAHNTQRSMRFDHPDVYRTEELLKNNRGIVDFRNNLIYNWRNVATHGGEAGKFNVINNYYKPGPATNDKGIFLRAQKVESSGTLVYDYGKFYIAGNIYSGNDAINRDNWKGVDPRDGTATDLDRMKQSVPFSSSVYNTTHSAEDAYKYVLQYSGASHIRDRVDTRILNEVNTGSFTFLGSRGSIGGIIDSQKDVGSWPVLKSAPPLKDTDGDGMPDDWEILKGLDPKIPNANGLNLHHYYTNIEMYINGLVSHISEYDKATPPSAPKLVSPSNLSQNLNPNVMLKWQAVEGAAKYQIQASKSVDFSSLTHDLSSGAATEFELKNLEKGTTYYWRVSASNGSGSGKHSDVWQFTTTSSTPIPAAPIQVSPDNGSEGLVDQANLLWNKVDFAEKYTVELVYEKDLMPISFVFQDLVQNQLAVNSLEKDTQYFWRVKALNNSGESAYSGFWEFTTKVAALAPPEKVILTSPSHQSKDLNNSIELKWQPSTGAERYAIQVSERSDFGTTFLNNPNITQTTATVSNLKSGTTYFWRVSASNTAGTSVYSDVFTFSVKADLILPTTPLLSSPNSGSSTAVNEVLLIWQKSELATSYRVQVGTSATFTSGLVYENSGAVGTELIVPGLLEGRTYYWRVSAVNQSGSSSFSETWSFSTTTASLSPSIQLPSKTELSSPNNGALNQNTSLTLSWKAATGASSYRLQVSEKRDFSTLFFDKSGLTSTSQAIGGLKEGTEYFWRVRATNAAGNGSWSDTWKFSTRLSTTVPLAPKLLSPTTGSILDPSGIELTWESSNNANRYHVQVSTASNFDQDVVFEHSSLTSTRVIISGLVHGKTYYWRVRAANSSGFGAYSTAWQFTTITAVLSQTTSLPSQVVLFSPSDKSIDQAANLTLNWLANSSAKTYTIVVSEFDDFRNNHATFTNLDGTSKLITGLKAGTKYFWKVKAVNETGEGPYSTTWTFTTRSNTAVPNKPILLAPASTSIVNAFEVELIWGKADGAEKYQIQISTTSDFKQLKFERNGHSGETIVPTGLEAQKTYYWRVMAINANGNSLYSDVWTFTTEPKDLGNTPGVPRLIDPIRGTAHHPDSVVLKWEKVVGSKYHIQVSTYPNFSQNVVFEKISYANETIKLTGLEFGKTYYWRVRAINGSGTSLFSSIWHFTTIEKPQLDKPQLISPSNDSTLNEPNLNFIWSKVNHAASYQLIIAKDSAFQDILIDENTGKDTTLNVIDLPMEQTYFWKVMAINAYDSLASDSWTFHLKEIASGDLTNLSLLLYPNPAKDHVIFRFSEHLNSPINIRIIDNKGIIMLEKSDMLNGKEFKLEFQQKYFPTGKYIVTITGIGFNQSKQLLIL